MPEDSGRMYKSPVLGLNGGLWVFRKSQKTSTAPDQYFLSYGKKNLGLRSVNISNLYFSTLPEYVVVETTEHKCLQSQFSVLYNEAMQLKTQLEENRFFIYY